MNNLAYTDTLDYPHYIRKDMLLLVSLSSLYFQYNKGTFTEHRTPDYVLLTKWLNPKIDKELDTSLTEAWLEYSSYISQTIVSITGCSYNYVQLHLAYSKYLHIKEYFNEYQTLKLNISPL